MTLVWSILRGNGRAGYDLRILWDDNNAVTQIPVLIINIRIAREGIYGDIASNARVLIGNPSRSCS